MKRPVSFPSASAGAFIAFFALQAVAAPRLPTEIAVGLAERQEDVVIDSDAPFIVKEAAGSGLLAKGNRVHLKVSGDRLVSDERRFPDVVVVQPGSGLLRYNGKLYRGWLEIRKAAANRIKIINHVGIDDYLNGVLPFEALANWKTETLKAQAVVCRTYAIASLRRHGTQGYDVCALTHCQVYHGASGEDPRTSRAVSETTGQIMTYKGYPIAAYFHDDCGGMTESAEDVWSGEKGHFPYLRRVRCPSIMSWKAVISRQDLAAAVSSPKLEASEITNFRVSSRTPSGRARMVAISTRRHGTISFSANALRLRLGADRIRSTFWRHIQRRRSGWEISGTGWGHGVGLCQLGAERLGEKGWSCREILEHYFKGIRIEHGIE